MTAFKGRGTYGNAAGVVTPLDFKLSEAAGLVKTTTPLQIRPGVFYSGTASLVSGTAGMSYSVAAYHIATQRSAGAGVVLGGNDGTLSVATTAAPGSNSRYDVVYHWHREYSLDGTDSNPVVGVVQGTAAASPTVPSLSAYPGAIELARILVPAGVTATNTGTTITQTAPFTCVDGGKVPFRTTTEMNVWTTALTDQRALDLSSQITYRWNGSAWVAAPENTIYCKLSRAAAVNGSNGSYATKILWDTEVADARGMHNASESKITVPVAGRYRVTARVASAAATATFFGVQLSKNGALLPETELTQTPTANSPGNLITTATLVLAANDYIEVAAYTIGALALTVAGLFFTVEFVGEA